MEKKITTIPKASKLNVDSAVNAAKKALEKSWSKIDASDRGILLSKLADLIDQNKHYLSCLETLDSGKPYTHSYFMDTTGISKLLRYYGGWTDKITGKCVPVDGDYLSYTLVQPVGVCGLILPWNMPLVSLGMKLCPALACGNTVVIKPDHQTSLTCLFVASLAQQAGFPAGVINVVTGAGETGDFLVKNEEVNKISFTGSYKTGRKIEENCSKTNIKRLTLELSGNCPLIVFPDTNVDEAVEMAHQGSFMNSGQMCTAAARTYVHEKIYDEFIAKSVARTSRKVVTDPFQLFCEQGPMISKEQLEKTLSYIKKGKDEGAILEIGGDVIHNEATKGGFYIRPAVFSNVTDKMTISKDEIFGPVQCLIKFTTTAEAIGKANNTKFGLAAGILTNDVATALEMAKHIESGTVWVNCYNAFAVQSPFGGVKMSGKGKEMGEESLLEYSTVKTITIKLPQISNVSKTSDTTKTYDASSLKSKQKSVDLKLS